MTTHDTRSQLLAEIAANPEDDTLRLAFADWLDEHGDAADRDRAEFVRVQCDLAGPLKDACGCGACPSSLPHGPDCLQIGRAHV